MFMLRCNLFVFSDTKVDNPQEKHAYPEKYAKLIHYRNPAPVG